MSSGEKVTYFGETDFRNRKARFGIRNSDRSRHVYVIGKTGMGKSTLLENMAAQDIMDGEGMCFVDPHGSAIDVLLEYVPAHRLNEVVYFAPFDTQFPISFNVLEDVDPDQRHLVMAGLMASFKKIWPDSFSARMEYILANTLLALLEYPGSTLLGVNRMLAEKDYRDAVIKNITDSSVKAFWVEEYNKWDPRYAKEAGAAIQNKIGQFTSNPLIRNIIGQEKTAFDFREIMDKRKILLVNLSKGRIGESNANLLGGMLITKLYLAAMSRADVGAKNLKNLPDFFFFVDEFQNFANESFADILAEARKYKLSLTVAHQYVDQMQEEVASAIFGNVGTMITFRIGPTDAEVFEKQFAPTFTAEDIVNLGKFKIYLSLMIDGIGSRPFSASTLAPLATPETSSADAVLHSSRALYARPRAEVESLIEEWYKPIKRNVVKKSFGDPKDKKNTNNSQKRNFDSPEKGELKKADEKEAELEMRKVISPRLNSLIDGFSGSASMNNKKKVFVASREKKIDEVSKKPLIEKSKFDKKSENRKEIFVSKKEPKKEVLKKATEAPPKKESTSVKNPISSTPSNATNSNNLKKVLDRKTTIKKNNLKTSKKEFSQGKDLIKKSADRSTSSENKNSLKDLLNKAMNKDTSLDKKIAPEKNNNIKEVVPPAQIESANRISTAERLTQVTKKIVPTETNTQVKNKVTTVEKYNSSESGLKKISLSKKLDFLVQKNEKKVSPEPTKQKPISPRKEMLVDRKSPQHIGNNLDRVKNKIFKQEKDTPIKINKIAVPEYREKPRDTFRSKESVTKTIESIPRKASTQHVDAPIQKNNLVSASDKKREIPEDLLKSILS